MAEAQQQDKAFEVFVKRAVTNIMKEGADKSWGRSKEAKELKDACSSFLTLLDNHEAGVASFEGSLAVAVLQVLTLACSNSNPKVVELSLGCLHKLVAHAWLHGESSMFEGLMDDGSDVVSQVVKLVVKCGESSASEGLQLAVIRALLTFTTAEHFVAHGDCLMSAVRAVFNLALGSEAQIIKRTACNALLQMLNTVAKRITCSLHHYGSLLSVPTSKRPSDMGEEHSQAYPQQGAQGSLSHQGRRSSQDHAAIAALTVAAHAEGAGAGADGGVGAGCLFDGLQIATQPSGEQRAPGAELASDARTAQFASLAEQSDLRGLEAAIGAAGGDGEAGAGGSGAAAAGMSSPLARASSSGPPLIGRVSMSPADSAAGAVAGGGLGTHLPRGSEPAGPGSPSKDPSRPSPKSPRALQHSHSLSALSVMERDVLQVLTAFCKLASRESGLTEVESFLHQGKLLALELLAKVLANPQHCWDAVRDEFCHHLTQPLAITLLRNCSAADAATFQLAIRLLVTIMLKPKLRRLLKAELGAFYPLFILRPLETGRQDLPTLYTVLGSVRQVCSEPQLLVDLFVNYDCDLAAPCLYERTVSALSSLAKMNDAELERPQNLGRQQEQAARLAAVRELALKSLLSVVGCLEAWAAPIRDAHARSDAATLAAAATAAVAAAGMGAGQDGADDSSDATPRSVSPFTGTGTGAGADVAELERLEALHSRKSALARGLALFNTSPVKGVRFMLQQQLIPGGATPAAVAAFLREHQPELGKGPLGEYFGHHDEFAISVMHAWIDLQRSWSGVPIDGALRLLLEQFRLPGEAQKIDRIMEKFAERYVRDNPGRFTSADGAYMLAFACIMLNTDAHNPLAERRLTKADFVSMNTQPVPAAPASEGAEGGEGEDGADVDGGRASAAPVFRPVLPMAEIEGIYDRIVLAEIKIRDDPGVGAGGAAAPPASAPMAVSRLAAALGLRALATPFRPVSRGWGRQQQGLSEPERKRQLVKLAERAVLGAGAGAGGGAGGSGGSGAGHWHASTHAGHARPLLTVTGGPLLEAVTYCLAGTKDAASAAPLIAALVAAVELSALLGLEELCEACVGALAKAVGVSAPAPYGSPEEGKQLAALRALLGLAGSPVAGLLGSGWTVLLQTAAALDALVADLAAGAPPPTPAPIPGGASDGLANPFNKMFAALGISLAGTGATSGRMGSSGGGSTIPVPPRAPAQAPEGGNPAPDAAASPTDASSAASLAPVPRFAQPAAPSALRAGSGAGLALWALSAEGYDAVSRLYTCSASLDGESVVVYFRALCAVSREELDAAPSRPAPPADGAPASPTPTGHAPPRLYSLQRLLDCAHANTNRIRLIRSKLWAVTAAHLVMVACHPAPAVAVYAVNALHGMAQRLLARGVELAHFEQQEEALRPFVSAMRVCDEPEVRRLVVRSALGSCAGRATGLGTGWRTVLELLRRAGSDVSPSVAAEAVIALPAVVDALYRSSSPQPPPAAPSPAGDGSPATNGRAPPPFEAGGPPHATHHHRHSQNQSDGTSTPNGASSSPSSPAPAATPPPQRAATARRNGPAVWLANGSHGYFQETVAAILAVAQNPGQPAQAGLAAVQLLQTCGQRLAGYQAALVARQRAAFPGAGPAAAGSEGASPAPTPGAGPGPAPGPTQEQFARALGQLESHWSLLLECLAGWAVGESRALVADAACQSVLELMACHGEGWGDAAWRVVIRRVLPRLLTPSATAEGGGAGHGQGSAAASPSAHAQRPGGAGAEATADFVARAGEAFPQLCEQVWVVPEAFREELLEQLSETCLSWYRQPHEALASLGLRCIELLARRLAQPSRAASWGLLLVKVVAVIRQDLASLMAHQDFDTSSPTHPGHSQQQRRLRQGAGAGEAGPASVVALATRSRLLLGLVRAMVGVQEQCGGGMPWRVQAPLAAVLVEAAEQLQAWNQRRQALAQARAGVDAHPRARGALGHAPSSVTAVEQRSGGSTQQEHDGSGGGAGADGSLTGAGVEGAEGAAAGHGAGAPTPPAARHDGEEVQSRGSEGLADTILEAHSWDAAARSEGAQGQAGAATSVPGATSSGGAAGPVAGGSGVAGGREGGDGDGAAPRASPSTGDAAPAGVDESTLVGASIAPAPAGGAPAPPGESALHGRPDTMELALSSAESRDTPVLCLGRLECEVVAGALSVLCHCLDTELQRQGKGGAGGRDGGEADGLSAERMLRSFCLRLIAAAAAAAAAPSGPSDEHTHTHTHTPLLAQSSPSPLASSSPTATGPSGPVSAFNHPPSAAEALASASPSNHHASSRTPGPGSGSSPPPGGSPPPLRDGGPPLEPWHAALRALHVSHAIRLCLLLPSEPGSPGSAADLWPYLMALISSPHTVVRDAVADALLAGWGAAGGGGAGHAALPKGVAAGV